MLVLDLLSQRMDVIKSVNQHRSLICNTGIDFSSNDYLGFTQDEVLKKRIIEGLGIAPIGSGGSRLLRGNLEIYEQAESLLAKYSNRSAAMFFPSGFQANIALLSGLLNKQDVVFSDQYNHASIIDGIRLSGAKKEIYAHNQLEDLERRLAMYVKHKDCIKCIVVESLYSMEGTLSPLKEIVALARKYQACVIVDEAHTTALYGETGAGYVDALGLSEHVIATVHTAGKALGVSGAWIATSEYLKSYLINVSRPFIFSTAPTPLQVIALLHAIDHWQEVGRARVERLRQLTKRVRAKLQALLSLYGSSYKGVGSMRLLGHDESYIIPLVLGSNQQALALSLKLQEKKLDIRAIRPPTVPKDSARIRIALHATHTQEEIDTLLLTIEQYLKNYDR